MRAILLSLFVFSCSLVAADDVKACGGFWCDGSSPVNQAAERIIFVDHDDDTVSAVVQIMYEGDSEDFAWVLPVPGTPEVAISSDIAFDRLQMATNPTYNLTTEIEGECAQDFFLTQMDARATAGAANEEADDSSVHVVTSGQVGPYDYEVISVEPDVQDKAAEALDWLTTNGYDLFDETAAVLGPYLNDGMNLIAFRLQKDATAGSVRPIRIRYEMSSPCIPIRPTSVAANDDMGVLVWNLGSARAVPTNYRSLVLNDTVINWLNPTSNYDDVINLAADEADGHGFVTEYAQESLTLDEIVWTDSDESNRDFLLESTGQSGHATLSTASAFSGWDGLADVIRAHLSWSGNVQADDIAGCLGCYIDDIDDNFDRAAFVAALDEEVMSPMRETQTLLLDQPYVTRLYTTMSAADMTEDPNFDFNADLDDVSNIHNATRYVECHGGVTIDEAYWRAKLPSGHTVRGQGFDWPVSTSDMPANRFILQDATSGAAQTIVDNDAVIAEKLAEINDRYQDGACGCRSQGGGSDAWSMLLGLVAAGAIARRRGQRGHSA